MSTNDNVKKVFAKGPLVDLLECTCREAPTTPEERHVVGLAMLAQAARSIAIAKRLLPRDEATWNDLDTDRRAGSELEFHYWAMGTVDDNCENCDRLIAEVLEPTTLCVTERDGELVELDLTLPIVTSPSPAVHAEKMPTDGFSEN